MGEEYVAKAVEADWLAEETATAALTDALIEMAKGYRLLASQAVAAVLQERILLALSLGPGPGRRHRANRGRLPTSGRTTERIVSAEEKSGRHAA